MRYVKDSLKIFFIICILLFSIFTSFTFITPKSNFASAIDPLAIYDSFLVFEIANSSDLDNPIHPLEGVKNINLSIKYFNNIPNTIKDSYLLKGLIFGFYKFVFLTKVNLTIDSPDWCHATIVPSYILFEAFEEGSELERIVKLQVAVNKNSTAFFPYTLQVKASGDIKDKHIKAPSNVTLPVTITPRYVPIISTDSGDTIKKTSPGEPLDWNITISNDGNGETLVKARIIDPPKGWIISVNPQIIIPVSSDGNSNEKTMSLTALPPPDIGYYNNKVQFEVELTPEFSVPGTGSTLNLTKGEPISLSFTIRLRGFSLPGFEFIFLICGILIFIVIRKQKISIGGSNH